MMKKALFLATFGAGLALSQAGGWIRRDGDASSRTTRLQELYFSEILSKDDTVTVLEAGGFKLTASCKTVTHVEDDLFPFTSYYGSEPPSSESSAAAESSSRGGPTVASSAHRLHGNDDGDSITRSYRFASARGDGGDGSSNGFNGGDGSSRNVPQDGAESHGSVSSSNGDLPDRRPRGIEPCGMRRAGPESAYSEDGQDAYDGYADYSSSAYSGSFNYTESFAALELTYTSPGDDYLYGSSTHQFVPDEENVIGSYKAGESRTQTVFGGEYLESSTFQSMSGRFFSISGDRTIGIHRLNVEEMETGLSSGFMGSMEDTAQDTGFPEGVECMIAGVITYVVG